MAMSIFLSKAVRKHSGKAYSYWILKRNTWDPKRKAVRQEYLISVGKNPVLTLAKAKALAKRIGVTLDDLRKVRRLKIAD
jgi:hypothetical protein